MNTQQKRGRGAGIPDRHRPACPTAALPLLAAVTGIALLVSALALGAGDRRSRAEALAPSQLEQGLRPLGHSRANRHGEALPRDDSRANDALRGTAGGGGLLFVGASYSVGWGATAPHDRFEDVVARRLGSRPYAVDAVAGTGFLNPGPRGDDTFGARIARLPTTLDPHVVLLQGGRDDRRYPAAQEYRAAVATLELAQRRFVHARVVLLGPVPATVPAPASERAIDQALARACATARVGYVDALAQGWITRSDERRYLGPVPGHPDDRGYAHIADRLLADLPAALRASRPPLDAVDNPVDPPAVTQPAVTQPAPG